MPNQIILKTITAAKIQSGGYSIKWEGQIPPASTIFLSLVRRDNRVDVTGGYNKSKMPQLLAAIDAVKGWGNTIDVLLTVEKAGSFVTESNAQSLLAPVPPYIGSLTFDGFWNAEPKFTYPGSGEGRMLTDPIGGKYYFRNGSWLETVAAKRGLDCTTFPMALFESKMSMAGKLGADLADGLGAESVGMELKSQQDVKAFFDDYKRGAVGLYIMYSTGHVVLVQDAIVHEFTNRVTLCPGYKRSDASTWKGYRNSSTWSVKKLPDRYKP